LNRAGFLALGAVTAGLLVENAAGANGLLTELDLALARLAVGAEILAAAFYTRAIASKQFEGEELKHLKRALFNEQEHLTAVSQILSGAGQTPSTADDFAITFPKGAFASRETIAKLGVTLETASVGTYLGAADAFGPGDLRTTAARIAASESQHLSVFSGIASNQPVGISFPAPIDYETASGLLDVYLS
jgi:rubrerythrin